MTGRSTYAGAGESAGVDWEQIGNKLAGESFYSMVTTHL